MTRAQYFEHVLCQVLQMPVLSESLRQKWKIPANVYNSIKIESFGAGRMRRYTPIEVEVLQSRRTINYCQPSKFKSQRPKDQQMSLRRKYGKARWMS